MAQPGSTSRNLFLATLILLGLSMLALLWFFPQWESQSKQDLASSYSNYCGACHLVPDPANLPKEIWAASVLPRMWEIQGAPEIDSLERAALTAYILGQAPDSLTALPIPEKPDSLSLFRASTITLENNVSHGIITGLNYDAAAGDLWIGDAIGRNYRQRLSAATAVRYETPLVSTQGGQEATYLTLIGNLGPSDEPKGKLIRKSEGEAEIIADSLRRPVYTHVEDLNNDGVEEILVCEFGNTSGALTLIAAQRRALINLPGCIKVEVADMDGDGKKDIIALFGQAREGIHILYQRENLQFESEIVLEFPPEFGSSWFELVDINADGKLDLVLANGDNADYSIVLKPFHGVRVFLNSGSNRFEESFFYPMYGATRVMARDFDQDGDIDLAATAFFPDFTNHPEWGFVYLQHTREGELQFNPQVTSLAAKGNWLVMETADLDTDGDLDLVLGNFYQFRDREFRKANPVDLLLLENTVN